MPAANKSAPTVFYNCLHSNKNYMYEKLGGVLNYIISIVIMTAAAFIIKRKGQEQPGVKFVGMSVKTILILVYIGILVNIIAMIMELEK